MPDLCHKQNVKKGIPMLKGMLLHRHDFSAAEHLYSQQACCNSDLSLSWADVSR